MKRNVVSMLLAASMVIGALTGCGADSSPEVQTGTAGQEDADSTDGDADVSSNVEEGKVINIYSWNDEFRERVEAVYPEVKET